MTQLSEYSDQETFHIDALAEELARFPKPHVRYVWVNLVIPKLRARAIAENLAPFDYGMRLQKSQSVILNLYESTRGFEGIEQTQARKDLLGCFWKHQSINLLKSGESSRGFSIYREQLLDVAADYVNNPDIQNPATDWYLMDLLVFAELDAFTTFLMSGGGLGFNWAWMIAAGNEPKYWFFKVIFSAIGFALFYVAPPALAVYLVANSHNVGAASVVAIWGLLLLWKIVTIPARWRHRRQSKKLLEHLTNTYAHLGSSVISPARFCEALKQAAAAGVVFDGALFAIADRVAKRDETAFVPFAK